MKTGEGCDERGEKVAVKCDWQSQGVAVRGNARNEQRNEGLTEVFLVVFGVLIVKLRLKEDESTSRFNL